MDYHWLFAVFDLGVLVLAAAELRRGGSRARARPAVLPAPVAAALLMAAYLAQLALVRYAVLGQPGQPPLPPYLPVPALAVQFAHADAVAAGMIALSALQTYLLFQLYRGAPSTRTIVVGSLAMTLLSLAWPAILSGDVYAYIGGGLLGRAAYDPPAVPFPGDLATINAWWGAPMPPSPYGPVEIAITALVGAPFATLVGKFFALRAFDAAVFGALVWLLHAFGLPKRVVAVAALNPGLLLQFVETAHNDLFGIVLVLAGGLVVRARLPAAFALVTAGALVKLPFAAFAWPLFGAVSSIRSRALLALGTTAVAGALLLLAGGRGVLRAAAAHVMTTAPALLLTLPVACAALIALAAAMAGPRRLLSAVWIVPLATSYTCPWYLAWSLPYAVSRRRVIAYLLVGFPLATTLLDVKFMHPWTLFFLVPLAFAWQLFELPGRKTA